MGNPLDGIARSPLAAVAITGVGLFSYGLAVPAYKNREAARALKGPNACDANGVVDGWHEQLAALETLRYPLMQSGFSLFLASVTIWLLIRVFGISGKVGLRTPRKRWLYFALGTGALVWSWLSQISSLALDFSRGEFPWCADSMGIPVFGITYFYLIALFGCILIGGLLALVFCDLPVRLFQWRSKQPIRSWFITVPFVIIGATIAVLGFQGAYQSSFIGTPAALVAIYLVEATRSSLLAQRSI